MLEKGDHAEIKLTVIQGIKEGLTEHYEKDHKELAATVKTHGRILLWVQGAWAGIIAWIKFRE